MDTIDCRSILKHQAQDADFYQLSALVKAVRVHLNSFNNKQGRVTLHTFEISDRLTTPLHNLDDLYTMLFKETERDVSEAHRKYLTICEKLVAYCYCYIHHFVELNDHQHRNNAILGTNEHAKKLAYEFYYNAAYELRTPCSALKGYSQPQILTFMGVDSPPFVPENQDKFDKISYWTDELWKFMDDLPGLWMG